MLCALFLLSLNDRTLCVRLADVCQAELEQAARFTKSVRYDASCGRVIMAQTTYRSGNIEVLVSPAWGDLNAIDREAVLCHEFFHYLDFDATQVRLLILSLPAEVSHAVMEIRAISRLMRTDLWDRSSKRRKDAELGLLKKASHAVARWMVGNEPYGPLDLKRIAVEMSPDQTILSQAESQRVLRQIKADFLSNLLAREFLDEVLAPERTNGDRVASDKNSQYKVSCD